MFIGLCDPWLGSSRCEGGNGVGLERRRQSRRGVMCVCVCVCVRVFVSTYVCVFVSVAAGT